MSLAHAVRCVVVDTQQLLRLYRQLSRVPLEVGDLFGLIKASATRLEDVEAFLARRDASVFTGDYLSVFKRFRSRLLDVELFIDPEQRLPRSGPGYDDCQVIPWPGTIDTQAVVEFCQTFTKHLRQLESDCDELVSRVERNESNSSGNSSEAEQNREQAVPETTFRPPSPVMSEPNSAHLHSPFAFLSPAVTPLTSPLASASHDLQHPVVSRLTLSDSPFLIPLPSIPSDLLANNSTSSSTRRRKRDKTTAEKRVQQMIEQQFGNPLAAGTKRKRPSHDSHTSPRMPSNYLPFLSRSPPPTYPPSSPRLAPSIAPEPLDDVDDNPAWSLDDLHEALPTQPTASKGKQRADNHHIDTWDSASSAHTGSSANSIHSSALSVFSSSSASPGRTAFVPGSCKISFTRSGAHQTLAISHLEILPKPLSNSHGTLIVALTSTGTKIHDDLWLNAHQSNAHPFLEHADVSAAMHPECPSYAVHFAPYPASHPRYVSTSLQDAWDFIQRVSSSNDVSSSYSSTSFPSSCPSTQGTCLSPEGKPNKTLCASIDVHSIKSNATHGHSAECGTTTLQIWESAESSKRSVKFYRNKNATADPPVVEFDCNCLRAPEREGKAKVVFGLRDVREGVLRNMKYVKVAFASELGKDEFLHEAGFSAFITAK